MRAVASRVHRLCEPFIVVAHETGHSAGAVRQLRWSDVDLAKAVVVLAARSRQDRLCP